MATREIWHEILINASPHELYQAVTDVKKLAHWWATDAGGSPPSLGSTPLKTWGVYSPATLGKM